MKVVIEQMLAILQEAMEGPAQPWCYLIDCGPEAGLLRSLAAVPARDANQSVGNTSIAAQAHHVLFSLTATASWIRGDRTRHDWQETWETEPVDEARWLKLRQDLEKAHQDLGQAIETQAASSLQAMGAALAALAHLGYHLGAIRQKIVILRQSLHQGLIR